MLLSLINLLQVIIRLYPPQFHQLSMTSRNRSLLVIHRKLMYILGSFGGLGAQHKLLHWQRLFFIEILVGLVKELLIYRSVQLFQRSWFLKKTEEVG